MRIAVAGGTGLIGTMVVDELRSRGHEPVVLARSTGADLVTGTGVAQVLDGTSTVIDVSNLATMKARDSVAFFDAVARHLLASGLEHLITLSIVGIHRVDLGYYQGKRCQEELLLADDRVSVLRATQFHEFAGQVLDRGRGPVAMVPRMHIQPVAAREVATALVDLVGHRPAGVVPELAGPEPLELIDLARQLSRTRRSRRLAVPIRLPGAVGRQLIGGGLLPTTAGPRGVETWAQWVARMCP